MGQFIRYSFLGLGSTHNASRVTKSNGCYLPMISSSSDLLPITSPEPIPPQSYRPMDILSFTLCIFANEVKT